MPIKVTKVLSDELYREFDTRGLNTSLEQYALDLGILDEDLTSIWLYDECVIELVRDRNAEADAALGKAMREVIFRRKGMPSIAEILDAISNILEAENAKMEAEDA